MQSALMSSPGLAVGNEDGESLGNEEGLAGVPCLLEELGDGAALGYSEGWSLGISEGMSEGTVDMATGLICLMNDS